MEQAQKVSKSDLEAAFDTQFRRLGTDLPDPEPEYIFHPTRKWRLDRAWPQHRVAVELEGGSKPRTIRCTSCGQLVRAKTKAGLGKPLRMPGWHQTNQFEANKEKYNQLALLGWILLRFTHDDVHADPFSMVEDIRSAIEVRAHQVKGLDYLSPEERESLYLIAAGFNSLEAASRLGKSHVAVRRRVQNVCEKLFVRSRSAAVARALSWQLIDPGKIPFPDGDLDPI